MPASPIFLLYFMSSRRGNIEGWAIALHPEAKETKMKRCNNTRIPRALHFLKGIAIASALFAMQQPASAASADVATAWKNAQKLIPGISKETVDAACSEGSAMMYSLILRGEQEGIIGHFEKLFPCIKLKVFNASGGVLSQRFTNEMRAGNSPTDIWMNSSPVYGSRLAKEGLLLNWTPPTASLIDDLWKDEGYWYAIGLAHIGIIWNTEDIKPEQKKWLEGVKTWADVPNGPFQNNTGLVDIRAGGTTQIFYYYNKQKYGVDYWKKLATLKPTIFSGVNPLIGRLVAGDFAYAAGITADTAGATQWLKGAPLQWKFPEPGLAVPYFIGISAKAPHPNAAKLFMAWSLSTDGQNSWVNSSGLAPASSHATDNRPYAKKAWYKLPKTHYRADWQKIATDLKADTQTFTSIFGK